MHTHDHLDRELVMIDRAILAAEDWAPDYRKDEDTFAELVKAEAGLARDLRRYFRELADDRVVSYIDWYAYAVRLNQVTAADDYSIEVIVNDDMVDVEDGLVMKFVFEEVSNAAAAGAQAGQLIYDRPIVLTSSSDAIQRVAKNVVAELVGKRVNKEGVIVNNPSAKYRVSEVTRNQIRQSIATSLSLGEDQNAAVERLRKVIKDPERAAKIAATEAVNAYQGGLHTFAQESGATKKEWQGLPSACKICQANIAAGEIAIDATFPSGHKYPSAHPWDRCTVRYIWPEGV